MNPPVLLVLAKAPRAGYSKTRLAPAFGAEGAARLAAAFELAALLVGMDTPQLTPADLDLDGAAPGDAALGPAADGRWWAMLLPRPRRQARRVLWGVPMSTAHTVELQLRALEAAGLRVRSLPLLRDVDEPADALAVAAAAPGTRFAAAVAELAAGLAAGLAGPPADSSCAAADGVPARAH